MRKTEVQEGGSKQAWIFNRNWSKGGAEPAKVICFGGPCCGPECACASIDLYVIIYSLTRIPPGQGFRKIVCGGAGLRFEFFGEISKNVDAKLFKIRRLNLFKITSKIFEKIIQNLSKIHLKYIPNQLKSILGSLWGVFGAKLRPGRPQVRSGMKVFGFFIVFWPKLELQGSILGPLENRKSLQNRTFEWRSALGTSKNGFREGVQKKHEILMEKWRKNDEKTMRKWMQKSIEIYEMLVSAKPRFWWHVPRENEILQKWRVPKFMKIHEKSKQKRVLEKIRKSVEKGTLKVMLFGPKSTLGRPRVDWFSTCGRFWSIRKIADFSMSLRRVKKSIKSCQGAFREAPTGSDRLRRRLGGNPGDPPGGG